MAADGERISSVSNAERCKRYRIKNKNNDDYKDKEKIRKQKSRKCRTPEQIERDRQTARERMRRRRERLVTENRKVSSTSTCSTIHTRKQTDKRRAKWCQYKQTYRANLSSQKKRRVREKDNEAKRNKMQQKIQEKVKTTVTNTQQQYTPAAARQAISRTRKKLPLDPTKFARVIKGLVDSATPRKRAALAQDNICYTPSKRKRLSFLESAVSGIKSTLDTLKKKKTDSSRIKQKHIVQNMRKTLKKHRNLVKVSKELGIRWQTMVKWSKNSDEEEFMSRKKRSDALPAHEVETVKDFFLKPYVSVVHATKETVSKENNQRQTLNMTLERTYEIFTEENPSQKISFSKFASLKPKSVKTVDKQNFRGCLCEKCVNIELNLKALNKELPKEFQIKDRYQLSKVTVCHYDAGFPKLDCVHRTCRSCGVENGLKDTLQSIEVKLNTTVTWNKWQTVKVNNKKTGDEHTKKMLVTHVTTMQQLIDDMKRSLEEFPNHLFVASWQYRQFTTFKENMPADTVLCVLDFAENYTARAQDEVQSAHWAQEQITIHPLVCYYANVTHEIVIISEDVKHDSHFVESCVTKAIECLQEKGIGFSRLVQFTDGCAGQYKSKIPFMDISSRMDIATERHFFGSGHGKGPADACSGVIKAAATRAVKGGQTISSAKELFQFAKARLQKDTEVFKRSFFLLNTTDISRNRKDSLLPIKGTRKLHSVKGVSPGVILTRELSCLCKACFEESGDECKSILHVKKYLIQKMLKEPKGKKSNNRKVKINETKTNTKTRSKKNQINQEEMQEPKCDPTGKKSNNRKVEINETNTKTRSKKNQINQEEMQEPKCEPTGKKSNNRKVKINETKTNTKTRSKKNQINQEEMQEPKCEPTGKKSNNRKVEINETNTKIRSKKKQINQEEMQEPKCEPTEKKSNNRKVKINETKTNTNTSPVSVINKDIIDYTDSLTREHFFTEILEDLEESSSFEELKSKCLVYEKRIPDINVSQTNYTIIDQQLAVDKEALRIMPEEVYDQLEQQYPVRVKADGNCLPRSGSVHAFGKEDFHIEIRTRTVIELAVHEDLYTSGHYVGKAIEEDSGNTLKSYTMYSEHYTPGDVITEEVVKRTFRKEVVDICSLDSFMGIWQLFGLASVLNRNLISVYPNLGNPQVRSDLNRHICARVLKSTKPVGVMWSSNRNTDMVPRNWVPNHFCPLLPVAEASVTHTLDPEDEAADIFSMDFSFEFDNVSNFEDLNGSLQETMEALETMTETVDPEIPKSLQENPQALQTMTETSDPETPKSNLETQESNPETHKSDPESPESDPETPESNPETPKTNLETHESNPETHKSDPETPELDPETPESNPYTHKSDPETPESNPETPKTNLETHESNPETHKSDPETPELDPETPESNPYTHKSDPETPESNLETPKSNLETHESNPETHKSDPETPESNPETLKSNLETHESNPETHKSDPETPELDPETPESNPYTHKSDPETPESNPETPKSNLETHESNPETHKSDPETPESNPETLKSNLETHESNPETHKSDPETPESDPETPESIPETPKSNPETHKSDLETPETPESNPEIHESHPEIHKSDPEIHESHPEIHKSNQVNVALLSEDPVAATIETPKSNLQTNESDPETHESNSETQESNLETPKSNPQIHVSDTETPESDPETHPETPKSNSDNVALPSEVPVAVNSATWPDKESTKLGLNSSMATQQKPRYCIGTFLKILHGKIKYPAVAVAPPGEMDEATDKGLWAQYLSRSGRLWKLDEKPFFVTFEDILKTLEPPSIQCAGFRLYYKFEKL